MRYHTETVIYIDGDGPARIRSGTNIEGDNPAHLRLVTNIGGDVIIGVTEMKTDRLLALAASMETTAAALRAEATKRQGDR